MELPSLADRESASSGARTPGDALPLVLSPRSAEERAVPPELLRRAERELTEHGAILFRGFDIPTVDAFRAFVESFGYPLLGYEFGSTPRSKVGSGVYSSTEYPAHQRILLHNEQSYSQKWPMKLWFYCATAPTAGGETPLADSREVYRRVDAGIRRRFEARGLMYVRNFGGGLDVPWQQVFDTEDRSEVERYCRVHGISCEWKEDGELRTRERCKAVAKHPRTGALVWFNQAHLFHVSALEPEVREALLESVDREDLPRNVYYGDGSDIEDSVLDEVRAALDALEISRPWQNGDVLMLDNMLVAHGRMPFEGPRRIVVAMADAFPPTPPIEQGGSR
jgi:alpha-ketoglutarate-dependent taurine dioxygenase